MICRHPLLAPSELGFSEHNLADGRIDIHRNYEAISAGEPRVSFPIRVDPLHDRLVDIVVPGPTGDADTVESAISDGESHIDTELLKAGRLVVGGAIPIGAGQAGAWAPWRLRRYRLMRRMRETRPEKSEGKKWLCHMLAVYMKSPQNKREFDSGPSQPASGNRLPLLISG
jgi:hypothetical protein